MTIMVDDHTPWTRAHGDCHPSSLIQRFGQQGDLLEGLKPRNVFRSRCILEPQDPRYISKSKGISIESIAHSSQSIYPWIQIVIRSDI